MSISISVCLVQANPSNKQTEARVSFCGTPIYFPPKKVNGIDFVGLVRRGLKTATRRAWGDARAKSFLTRVGWWFPGQTSRLGTSRFGWLQLEAMYQERLGDMTVRDLCAEGCAGKTLDEFLKLPCFKSCSKNTVVWVIRFRFAQSPN
jgi:hypothetical protein